MPRLAPEDKTHPTIRGTTTELRAGARALRRRMTPVEQVLWDALKERQLNGLKFRCQHPVGPFVVDLYCSACKLVIELDGAVHETQSEQDQARTEHLNAFGYQVLRIRNDEVLTDLPSVLERIATIATSLNPASTARRTRRQSRP